MSHSLRNRIGTRFEGVYFPTDFFYCLIHLYPPTPFLIQNLSVADKKAMEGNYIGIHIAMLKSNRYL